MPNDNGAPIPMTAFGFEALKAELAELRARRPALVEEVAAARSQGDLSENFAYHDARQHLGMLDGRVQTIEAPLARGQVIEESGAKGVAPIRPPPGPRRPVRAANAPHTGPLPGKNAPCP